MNLNSFNFYILKFNGTDDIINGLNFNNYVYGGEYQSLISEWKIKAETALSTYYFEREQIKENDFAFILNVTPPLRTTRIPFYH